MFSKAERKTLSCFLSLVTEYRPLLERTAARFSPAGDSRGIFQAHDEKIISFGDRTLWSDEHTHVVQNPAFTCLVCQLLESLLSGTP